MSVIIVLKVGGFRDGYTVMVVSGQRICLASLMTANIIAAMAGRCDG